MKNLNWHERFEKLHANGVERYKAGIRGAVTLFNEEEKKFLAEIGHTAQELYDFCEDAVNYGEPDFATALLVASVRRDYFFHVQKGTREKPLPTSSLPAKEAAVEGIVWLPRIIEKARRKLRGQMDADLMYGCGGDRRFFKEHDIHPADFLRVVWAAGSDDAKIISFVKNRGDLKSA
jgi:hypothetical protein